MPLSIENIQKESQSNSQSIRRSRIKYTVFTGCVIQNRIFFLSCAKNVQIASFYSGFDWKQYIGHPNHCVSIILEPSENPTKWEPYLRRLTYDLLPELARIRGESIISKGLSTEPKYQEFDQLLGEKFQELLNGSIEPMSDSEGEIIEGEGTVIETVEGLTKQSIANDASKRALSRDDIAAAAKYAQNGVPVPTSGPMDSIKEATTQMENMEKDALRNEIRNMQKILQEKEDKVRALEAQCRELQSQDLNETGDASKLKGEYEALLAAKEQELDTWRSKVSELNENNFINQDNIRKLTEMTMMQTDDLSHQMQTINELRKQVKVLESNAATPQEVSEDDVNTLKSHAIELEESLKTATSDLEQKTEANKVLFIKTKKLENEIDELKETLTQAEAEKASVSGDQSTFASQLHSALLESNSEADGESNTNTRLIDAKVTDLEAQLKALQSELIDAKKTIKIQRREIENLQKLAGL